MNGKRRCSSKVSFHIVLFLVLLSSVGCASTATRLASLKANYNEGKWGYVLGTTTARGAYSADEVIKAAGDDALTADQAKLIKARALMHRFIQDKLAASADAVNDPDVAEAIRLVGELSSKNYNLNWMNVEMMASIADYFYLLDNYAAALDAYDYLLNYANFESLDASYRQYIRRWVEMKRQLDGMKTSSAYIDNVNKKFKKTYMIVVKKFPGDIGVVKAGVMILDDDGYPRAAIQRAMLARFTTAKNPKTKKQFVEEIDNLVTSILNDLSTVDKNEMMRLKKEYDRFRTEWDAATLATSN